MTTEHQRFAAILKDNFPDIGDFETLRQNPNEVINDLCELYDALRGAPGNYDSEEFESPTGPSDGDDHGDDENYLPGERDRIEGLHAVTEQGDLSNAKPEETPEPLAPSIHNDLVDLLQVAKTSMKTKVETGFIPTSIGEESALLITKETTMPIVYQEEIENWTPEEKQRLCRLLAWWFPTLPYADEETPGADAVEDLCNLYAWSGGSFLDGRMPGQEDHSEE